MPNIIWLDSTEIRKAGLIATFGSEGDWLNIELTDISCAKTVFAHASDLFFLHRPPLGNDNPIKLRIDKLRKAISELDTNSSTPLIVVYSGAAKTVRSTFLRNIKSIAPKYPENLIRIDCPNTDPEQLKKRLPAKSQEEHDTNVKQEFHDADVACAIDLVAEVVAWLKVTQNNIPSEMEDIRRRLSHAFSSIDGPEGEKLVDELSSAIKLDVKMRVAQKVEVNIRERVESWENAGMISDIGDRTP